MFEKAVRQPALLIFSSHLLSRAHYLMTLPAIGCSQAAPISVRLCGASYLTPKSEFAIDLAAMIRA